MIVKSILRAIAAVGLSALAIGCSVSSSDEPTGQVHQRAIGDCSVTMNTTPGSPVVRGTSVTIGTSGVTCAGAVIPEFRYLARDPSGTWTELQAYSTATSYAWDTTSAAPGTWYLQVWVRRQGATDAYEGYDYDNSFVITTPACDNVTSFTASPSSPQPAGTSVTLTATTASCSPSTPEYKFYHRLLDGTWVLLRDWGASASTTWDTTGEAAGVHTLQVWTRAQGSTAAVEGSKNLSFQIAPSTTCTAVTIGASPSSPSVAGTSVEISGTATCGGGTPEYKFYRREPSGAWTVVQDYSASNKFTWNTTGVTPDTYTFQIWSRVVGSTAAVEAGSQNLPYTITAAGTDTCTSATISAAPASTATAGTTVVVTGGASCGAGTPQFKFYRRETTGVWTMVQDWGSSNTFNWNTTGATTGSYSLQVWARVVGSSSNVEASANIAGYTITGGAAGTCETATLTTTASSPQKVGTMIPLTATSTCSGGATPEFRLWIQNPAGIWSIYRDYAASGNITWDTTGLATGSYNLQIWTRAAGSTAPWEGNASILGYQLN